MYSLNVYPAPSKSRLFLGAGSARPTLLRFASGSRSTSGSSLPPGQGLGWRREGQPAQATGTMHHPCGPALLCLLRAPGCGWLRPVLEAQERALRAESRHGSEMGTGRARLEEAWVLPPPALQPRQLAQPQRSPPRHLCLPSPGGSLRHLLCARPCAGTRLGKKGLCGAHAPIADGRRQTPSRVRWR